MNIQNEYYLGMPRLLFSSSDQLKESLSRDGWRRATKITWFRVVGREIEFLVTGQHGPRGVPYASYVSKKCLDETSVRRALGAAPKFLRSL